MSMVRTHGCRVQSPAEEATESQAAEMTEDQMDGLRISCGILLDPSTARVGIWMKIVVSSQANKISNGHAQISSRLWRKGSDSTKTSNIRDKLVRGILHLLAGSAREGYGTVSYYRGHKTDNNGIVQLTVARA